MAIREIESEDENGPKFEGFPYKPYSIEVEFMKALYGSLDKGGISMLESPTGPLSLANFVYDQRQKDKSKSKAESDNGQIGFDDEPDWMRNFVANANKDDDLKKQEKEVKLKSKLGLRRNLKKRKIRESYNQRSEKGEDFCVKKGNNFSWKKRNDEVELSDKGFLLEDYENEDEGTIKSKRKIVGEGLVTPSSSSDKDEDDDEDDEEKELRIYFCSRMHSQLSQFVKELRNTHFVNDITVVCLGSRKNFCVNKEVLKLGNATRINERCLEL
ncbi:conserved hypothetical protein [Ricinus communis]|uniref:RAD3-like helicase DEAD domain-containing protein n=1 Tax=Ricinus communis TaxID=3988 RepID=B9RQN2_RICCO|nr:conserved hypothetical protein [Ricinus communis]